MGKAWQQGGFLEVTGLPIILQLLVEYMEVWEPVREVNLDFLKGKRFKNLLVMVWNGVVVQELAQL